jgi:hypothetical protein
MSLGSIEASAVHSRQRKQVLPSDDACERLQEGQPLTEAPHNYGSPRSLRSESKRVCLCGLRPSEPQATHRQPEVATSSFR